MANPGGTGQNPIGVGPPGAAAHGVSEIPGVPDASWTLDAVSVRGVLAEAQPPKLRSAAAHLLLAAADIVARDGSALDLAAAVGMNPRTLSRALSRAGLPPGVRVLQWLRVLVAAKVLEQPGASVADAAVVSGYSTRGAVSRVIKERTGMAPSALVQRGAFETAVSRFRAELAACARAVK